MKPAAKTTLIVTGIFAGLGILGLSWYLWDENNKKNAPCPDPDNMHKDETGNCVLNTPETPPVIYTPPPPIDNVGKPTNVLAFQQYANAHGWLPQLTYDGWGPKTAAAWVALKAEYLKPTAVAKPTTAPVKITTGFVLGQKLFANNNYAIINAYKTAIPSAAVSNIYKSYKPNYFIGTFLNTEGEYIKIAAEELGAFGKTDKTVYVLKGSTFATK